MQDSKTRLVSVTLYQLFDGTASSYYKATHDKALDDARAFIAACRTYGVSPMEVLRTVHRYASKQRLSVHPNTVLKSYIWELYSKGSVQDVQTNSKKG